MTEVELNNLATGWISYWLAQTNSNSRVADLDWVMDLEYELMQEQPEQILRMILEILKLNNSNRIQEVLSAGPLEDLLAQHGDLMIDAIESEAKKNPIFSQLLGGVWQNSMSDAIWNRVQAVWNRSGWDGIQE